MNSRRDGEAWGEWLVLLSYLRKAFDTINHGMFIKEILDIGASNVTVKSFESYLSERTQRVCFKRYNPGLSSPEYWCSTRRYTSANCIFNLYK